MSFSYASVVETIQLGPCLRRITLRVDDPTALAVRRAGDSAVGLFLPTVAPDGDRIQIDVVLHARGPGTVWARTTAPGDRVGLDHARSWYRPEPTTDWQLLVTDLSGLPATARIIEELPLIEDDIIAIYERALADGKDDKAAFEDYDDALERAGL